MLPWSPDTFPVAATVMAEHQSRPPTPRGVWLGRSGLAASSVKGDHRTFLQRDAVRVPGSFFSVEVQMTSCELSSSAFLEPQFLHRMMREGFRELSLVPKMHGSQAVVGLGPVLRPPPTLPAANASPPLSPLAASLQRLAQAKYLPAQAFVLAVSAAKPACLSLSTCLVLAVPSSPLTNEL